MDREEKKPGARTRAGSIVAVAVLLALALGIAGFLAITQPSATGEMVAKVTVDDEVVAMMPLSRDARQVVESADGVNTVVVEGGAVHIEDADCPGGDCMRQGVIDRQGRLLVCLPHKLIVEIVPSDGNVGPSAYTGSETVGSDGWEDIDVVAR